MDPSQVPDFIQPASLEELADSIGRMKLSQDYTFTPSSSATPSSIRTNDIDEDDDDMESVTSSNDSVEILIPEEASCLPLFLQEMERKQGPRCLSESPANRIGRSSDGMYFSMDDSSLLPKSARPSGCPRSQSLSGECLRGRITSSPDPLIPSLADGRGISGLSFERLTPPSVPISFPALSTSHQPQQLQLQQQQQQQEHPQHPLHPQQHQQQQQQQQQQEQQLQQTHQQQQPQTSGAIISSLTTTPKSSANSIPLTFGSGVLTSTLGWSDAAASLKLRSRRNVHHKAKLRISPTRNVGKRTMQYHARPTSHSRKSISPRRSDYFSPAGGLLAASSSRVAAALTDLDLPPHPRNGGHKLLLRNSAPSLKRDNGYSFACRLRNEDCTSPMAGLLLTSTGGGRFEFAGGWAGDSQGRLSSGYGQSFRGGSMEGTAIAAERRL
ncbi:hypothetical protein HDU97_006793 [Phlyctochytrium planicorne]|nr:hypothetical protein HDU97_006793 [Phlyctochytrium planicorne]